MVTATPSRRATAPALSASSATRPLRRVIRRDPDGITAEPVCRPRVEGRSSRFTTPASQGAYDRGSTSRSASSAVGVRPSAARPPRPGRAAAAASAANSPAQHVVVLELDPPGGRVLGVVDVDARPRSARPARRRAPRAAGGGGLDQRLARRRVAAAGVGPAQREAGLDRGAPLQQQPARPGRPAAPRRPGAAGPARWCASATVAAPTGAPGVVDQLDQVRPPRRASSAPPR